jgi:hypothetical protein
MQIMSFFLCILLAFAQPAKKQPLTIVITADKSTTAAGLDVWIEVN